jgi:hypothetical protein
MKPNFEAMTKAELRAYVLEHRDDLDALEALFSRHSPDSTTLRFALPQTEEEWQQQLEIIRPILEKDREREMQRKQTTDESAESSNE